MTLAFASLPAKSRKKRQSGRHSGSQQLKVNQQSSVGTPVFLQRSPSTSNGSSPFQTTEINRSVASASREAPAPGTQHLTTSQTGCLAHESGSPLGPQSQRLAEQTFGHDFPHASLHKGPDADMATSLLGARAFTHGHDIWLGCGTSESDQTLMAHELAHTARHADGLYLREATYFERRAWLSFFDHYLPRKFLNNYMDDTGNAITLSLQEMQDVNPRININHRRSRQFKQELAALQQQMLDSAAANNGQPVPQVKSIEVYGPGQAMTNGTLGNFTIKYKGILTVMPDGNWTFIGTMSFYDYWDFDPKPFGRSGRSTAGEVKTRVAANFLPGQAFYIYSVEAFLVQTGQDPHAAWAGGVPQFVNDRAGRAGSDVGAGGDVGSAGDVGGPDVGGADVETGAETGAQSAEDLNP